MPCVDHTGNASLSWEQRVFLAGNEALECQYIESHRACIALQISRNYRLLAREMFTFIDRAAWLDKAEDWLNCYQQLQNCKKG